MSNLPKPNNCERAARYDNEVAEVVAKGHTSEDGERGMELNGISLAKLAGRHGFKLTVAPMRPFTVMTRPMIKLPRTQAPIAILQLSPAAIMDEATSQLDTAQASAIQ
jgi:hypothetical protein